MLLNIPAVHKTAPHAQNYLVQSVNSAEVEKPCSRAPGDTSFEEACIKFSFQWPLSHLFSACYSLSL